MLLEEFEKRTGYFPTMEEYAAIEKAYTEFGGDKDAFCKAYKKNEDGIAEKIQREVNMQHIKAQREAEKAQKAMEERIAKLEKELDQEQEWRPCENPCNVKQADYERLAEGVETGKHSHYMTDDDAIAWICDIYGFDPIKVAIIHEIDEYEVNRRGHLRKTGRKIDRRPVYCATDRCYIRFNSSSHWCYEVWNGLLRPFYD